MSTQAKLALMAAHKSLVKQGYYHWARAVLRFLNGDREERHWASMALASINVFNLKLF